MHRLFGTILICAALVALATGSNTALASDSPQKYGVELRGGFGTYDMGDVETGVAKYSADLWNQGIIGVPTFEDKGPQGGFSFLYRPSRHTLWEVGYNALMDVESTINSIPDTASGQYLMHANEFFLKGNVVATVGDRLLLNFGAGLAYYNAELQIQDNFSPNYVYDADGRAFGLTGGVGVEFLVTKHFGVVLEGGGRLANATHFTYRDGTSGTRVGLNAPGGGRPMEVNLSGAHAALGLRFYFDPTTKPVDFTR